MKRFFILILFFFLASMVKNAYGADDGRATFMQLLEKLEAEKKPEQSVVDKLIKLIKDYSESPAVGFLPEFTENFSNFFLNFTTSSFQHERPYITNCDVYPLLFDFLSFLFDKTMPMQQLLTTWDKREDIVQNRTIFLNLYKDMVEFYIKLKIVNIYLKEQNDHDAAVAKIIDTIDSLAPALQNKEFKEAISSEKLSNFTSEIQAAFNYLIGTKPTFIKDYCALQNLYFKQWPDEEASFDEPFEKYREGEDEDWDYLNPDQRVVILKNFTKKEIEPLYGNNLKETSKSLQAWLGKNNDVLSFINAKIIDDGGTPYEQEKPKEEEFFSTYNQEITETFQKNVLGIIDDAQFSSKIGEITEKIQKNDKIPSDQKAKLNTILNQLDQQKKIAQRLLLLDQINIKKMSDTIWKAAGPIEKAMRAADPEAWRLKDEITLINQSKDIFNKALQDLQKKASTQNPYAGARILRTMQAADLEKALSIFNLLFPVTPPSDPSPQADQYRSLITSYISAARSFENIEDQYYKEGKQPSGILWNDVTQQIEKLKKANISPLIDSWVGEANNLIRKYAELTGEKKPPPAPTPAKDLSSLYVELDLNLRSLWHGIPGKT